MNTETVKSMLRFRNTIVPADTFQKTNYCVFDPSTDSTEKRYAFATIFLDILRKAFCGILCFSRYLSFGSMSRWVFLSYACEICYIPICASFFFLLSAYFFHVTRQQVTNTHQIASFTFLTAAMQTLSYSYFPTCVLQQALFLLMSALSRMHCPLIIKVFSLHSVRQAYLILLGQRS